MRVVTKTSKPRLHFPIKTRHKLLDKESIWMKGIAAPKKKVVKGRTLQKKKIRTSVHFRRPQTHRLAPQPTRLQSQQEAISMADSVEVEHEPKKEVVKKSAKKKVVKGRKKNIKPAVKKLYNIECGKINTLVTTRHAKKAYVRLAPDFDALDVANKIGII